MIGVLDELQDRVDRWLMLSLTHGDEANYFDFIHKEAEAREKLMACPVTAVFLLTDNECQSSAFSKQN